MKYKVGDKVVVLPKANPLLGGLSGIVVETQENPIADTAYYKVDLDEERVFPEHHLIAETEYRFLTELNVTAHQLLATCGIKATDSDTKVLRAKDGTIIGDFSTGGVLPTSEWSKLIFKNGSSIEVLPQKDDTVRCKNHFCTGFRGGKIPTPEKPVSIEEQLGLPKGVSIHDLSTTELIKKEFNVTWLDKIALPTATETKEMVERVRREILNFTNAFPKEEKKLKFTFYTEEGYRIDKSNNSKVETITTFVKINGFDNTYLGMATCDKADYSERDGILNAIANAVLGGNFDREYEKFLADKKHKYDESCKCKICGRNYYEDEKTGKRTPFTPEDARKHEEWHEQNKKNKREKYLIRKEAKRRLAEAEREGKIEQTMKELYEK